VSVGFADRFPITLILWLLLFVPVVKAQDVPFPPAPTQYVTDTVGFLPPQVVERLNARLRDYEQQTRHQLIVYIGSTTGDVPIEDWAFRVFERWGVGRKDLDDGLALFIMAKIAAFALKWDMALNLMSRIFAPRESSRRSLPPASVRAITPAPSRAGLRR